MTTVNTPELSTSDHDQLLDPAAADAVFATFPKQHRVNFRATDAAFAAMGQEELDALDAVFSARNPDFKPVTDRGADAIFSSESRLDSVLSVEEVVDAGVTGNRGNMRRALLDSQFENMGGLLGTGE